MTAKVNISIFVVLALISCRKDPPIPIVPVADECQCILDNSNSSLPYETKDLTTGATVLGPYFFDQEYYSYHSPVQNPNNPNEIVFRRVDSTHVGLESELWKYNSCSGALDLVTSNFYYNLDWSSDDWIIYTGTNYQIYKVRSDGSSLTQLSSLPGFNNAGQWNDQSTMYSMSGDNGNKICSADGVELYTVPAGLQIIDWMNDSLLICQSQTTFNFWNYNIYSSASAIVNSNIACATCPKIYNPKTNSVYVSEFPIPNQNKQFLIFDLQANSVDSLFSVFRSYFVGVGSILSCDRILTTLTRQEWRDSLTNEIYTRSDLMVMDLDGLNQRVIEIP